jgi:hypothetical protein
MAVCYSVLRYSWFCALPAINLVRRVRPYDSAHAKKHERHHRLSIDGGYLVDVVKAKSEVRAHVVWMCQPRHRVSHASNQDGPAVSLEGVKELACRCVRTYRLFLRMVLSDNPSSVS